LNDILKRTLRTLDLNGDFWVSNIAVSQPRGDDALNGGGAKSLHLDETDEGKGDASGAINEIVLGKLPLAKDSDAQPVAGGQRIESLRRLKFDFGSTVSRWRCAA